MFFCVPYPIATRSTAFAESLLSALSVPGVVYIFMSIAGDPGINGKATSAYATGNLRCVPDLSAFFFVRSAVAASSDNLSPWQE